MTILSVVSFGQNHPARFLKGAKKRKGGISGSDNLYIQDGWYDADRPNATVCNMKTIYDDDVLWKLGNDTIKNVTAEWTD